MAPRLVVLGWDSATFDIVDPLIAEGRLPNLASLITDGCRAPLRSTWPPMTDCAWTSAFTGVNPGAHGIFGSWYRAPGAYACRYFSSRDRRARAVWELASEVRWLVWNVPMTYPPERINGAMVAGYGAPPGAAFCEPAGLQTELARRWNLDDLLDRAPHGSLTKFRDDLVAGLDAQADAISWAAEEAGADCVAAVWPQVDRAQHFFWRFRSTKHELSDAVARVYSAMDAATGKLRAAWPDADFLIVSDHGAGDLKGDVNLGAWLAHNGYASYGSARRSWLDLAWALPVPIRRLGRRVAPSLARRAFAQTMQGQLGPFDWAKTKVFLGVHGDLWLNLQGREPNGFVPPSDSPALLEEVSAQLLDLSAPNGERVLNEIHRRDDIYSGPASSLAPDAILDSWSQGYRVAPKREMTDVIIGRPNPLAGVEEAWSSDHRPVGIFAAAGPNIARADLSELSLYDVCPTTLALLGQVIPSDIDGKVATAALTESFSNRSPVRPGPAAGARSTVAGYSDAEAEALAEHLRNLGYIE